MVAMQQKIKKYDLKFKLSVVNYAEENSGEAAARRFSVDPKRGRNWRKYKMELQCLSEEDSNTPRESVPQNDQGDGETNVRHREWQER